MGLKDSDAFFCVRNEPKSVRTESEVYLHGCIFPVDKKEKYCIITKGNYLR